MPLRWMSASSFRGAGALTCIRWREFSWRIARPELDLAPSGAAASTCLDTYLTSHEWDAAFDLVSRGHAGDMAELMSLALDELLETARLATVSRWSDDTYECGYDLPIFALSRAEVALRHGRHSEAIAHAELAAATDDALEISGALALAGRAGHLASLEEQALAAYERAEAVASSESEVQDAKWGQLMCAIELEAPHAEQWLRGLDAGVLAWRAARSGSRCGNRT